MTDGQRLAKVLATALANKRGHGGIGALAHRLSEMNGSPGTPAYARAHDWVHCKRDPSPKYTEMMEKLAEQLGITI